MKERENQSDRYERGEFTEREVWGGEMRTETFAHHFEFTWLCSHAQATHLRSARRGARFKRKTSERITSCLSVCLDARAMFMSGDTRKTNIKVREAGACPSDR